MAKAFVNYTSEQLIALSIIMAKAIRKEYDEEDQLIIIQLLGLVSDNLGLMIAQDSYIGGLLDIELGEDRRR